MTALREAGPVTVLDLDEAKSITRATLETSTTMIVATVQAFVARRTDGLKVYAVQRRADAHFENLGPRRTREPAHDENGAMPYSLANVLRLRRPFLVVDEAHNNRTDDRSHTLAAFNPSGIMELTATPDTESTPSNVLHSVSRRGTESGAHDQAADPAGNRKRLAEMLGLCRRSARAVAGGG